MIAFRWRNLSLFQILMFQLTATAGQWRAFFTVKVGEEVALPCVNVIQEQSFCSRIMWRLQQPGTKQTWFQQGSFTQEAKAKSDRLSVTADCSLVIKNVGAQDFGKYICRRVPGGQPSLNTRVDLSVVTMTKQKSDDEVTLNCSVSKYTYCRHTVAWLYEGKEKLESHMNVSRSCSARVTFPASHLHQNSKFYELLKCKVRDGYDRKDQLFTFSPESPGGKTDFLCLIRYVVILLGLAVLLGSVVVIFIGTKTTA